MSRKDRGHKPRLIEKVTPQVNIVPGMVVYNEADRLFGWLSRHPFYKRIIVIDQGSTDNTVQVLKSDPRVEVHSTLRFEHCGEPNFNVLFEMGGTDGVFLTAPDEFITEAMHTKMQEEVAKAYTRFGVTAIYISRKNMINGQCVSGNFATQRDPDGKDWQLRISLGVSINYPAGVHATPVALGKYAYLHDDIYISHEKTVAEDRASMDKRQLHSNPRDRAHRKLVDKVEAMKGGSADEK